MAVAFQMILTVVPSFTTFRRIVPFIVPVC
jgi:hypothetical protein